MSGLLYVRNRQRGIRVEQGRLRRIIRELLEEELRRDEFELGVFLVGTAAMTRLNRDYLGHSGSTDVITFDYRDPTRPAWVGGEIFVCVPEALAQAKRFRTTWQCELVRYIVHGVLHLLGFDDHGLGRRRQMKREEDRLVKRLAATFSLARLGEYVRIHRDEPPGNPDEPHRPGGSKAHD